MQHLCSDVPRRLKGCHATVNEGVRSEGTQQRSSSHLQVVSSIIIHQNPSLSTDQLPPQPRSLKLVWLVASPVLRFFWPAMLCAL